MIIVWILLALTVLYLFLIAPPLKKNKTLAALGRVDLCHRGLFYNERGIPENSMPAFEGALQSGHGFEFDIHLTKDDELVVFHDDTLERMTNGHGRVVEHTLEELRALRLLDTDEKIPTLREVLDLAGSYQTEEKTLPLLVEFKFDRPDIDHYCTKAFEMLDSYKGVYLMESFDPRIVMWVRKHKPDVARGQLATKGGVNAALSFLLSNLMMNFLARPDFVAYDENFADSSPSVWLWRKLFKGHYFEWTTRQKTRLEANAASGKSSIFEDRD